MLAIVRRLIPRSPLVIGSVAMLTLVPLLAWDVAPRAFPPRSHDLLGALPLFVVDIFLTVAKVSEAPQRR